MARKPVAEFCFVCGNAPCSCNAKKVPAKKVAPPPAVTTVAPVCQPEPRRVTLAGFKPPVPKKVAPKVINTTRDPDVELAQLKRAVTILVEAGLVSAESIAEHRSLVELTDEEIIQIRASEWRRRKESRDATTDK